MIRCFLPVMLVILLAASGTSAQSTSGPAYNMYGVGGLNGYGIESFRSKGNAAIGARDAGAVNLKNPAALNAIYGPTHIFDVGLYMSALNQKMSLESEQTMLGGLSTLNLWFKTGKGSGLAIGANEFSDARYDITDEYRISDLADFYSVRFTGSGGLVQYYAAFSQRIFKNLDVGVRGSLIAGHLGTSQYIYNNTLFGDIEITNEQSIARFIADFGVQYTINMGKYHALMVGGTYQPQFLISTNSEQSIIKGGTDSLTTEGNGELYLPEMYGVGLSYRYKTLSINLDREMQRWSVNEAGEDFSYQDLWRNSLGIEYVKDPASDMDIKRMPFRAGFSWDNNYLKVKNNRLATVRASFGFGLPVERGRGLINLGYQYAYTGTGSEQLITETTHKIMLNISYRDLWFQRTKYE